MRIKFILLFIFLLSCGSDSSSTNLNSDIDEDVEEYIEEEYDEELEKEEAIKRSSELGCKGFHTHDDSGQTIYMPCSTHDEYEQLTSEEEEYEDEEYEDDSKMKNTKMKNTKMILKMKNTKDSEMIRYMMSTENGIRDQFITTHLQQLVLAGIEAKEPIVKNTFMKACRHQI